MTTQRQLLGLMMTILMLGTGLAGCLGGDDGGGDPVTEPNDGGDGTGDPTFADSDGDGIYDVIDQCACLLYTSPSPRDQRGSRMPSSA